MGCLGQGYSDKAPCWPKKGEWHQIGQPVWSRSLEAFPLEKTPHPPIQAQDPGADSDLLTSQLAD